MMSQEMKRVGSFISGNTFKQRMKRPLHFEMSFKNNVQLFDEGGIFRSQLESPRNTTDSGIRLS